jgi:hypothetical protein
MNKTSLKRRQKIRGLASQPGKEISVEGVVAQFQSALFCIDQFGFSGALIMVCFMVTSFLVQAARSVVEKGII